MTKRNDPVPRPPKSGEWQLRAASNEAANGWDVLMAQAPGPLAVMYDRLITDPRQVTNSERQGKLKGQLGSVEIKGQRLSQWQYEVTGGGRVWYAPDDDHRTVWITVASASHPKATE